MKGFDCDNADCHVSFEVEEDNLEIERTDVFLELVVTCPHCEQRHSYLALYDNFTKEEL